MRPLYLFVGIAAVLAVGIAVFFGVVQWNRRGKAKQEISGPRETAELTTDQGLFVQERVERYRDEMLRYELGLERHRRNASRDMLLKVLAGRGEVISMPVLYLNNKEWVCEESQLWEAVEISLRELGLSYNAEREEPTAHAAHACEKWAAEVAKREFDEFLGTDTQSDNSNG